MSVNIIFISALLALNIVTGFKAIQSYGRSKYIKGKLDGFNDCTKIQHDVFNKLKKEHDAEQEEKQDGLRGDSRT